MSVSVPSNESSRGVWGWIKQPADITFGMMLFYAVLTVLSVLTYNLPPTTVSQFMGAHVTWLWPSLWIMGGVVGLLTTIQGWWIIERAGLVMIFAGTSLYGFATLEALISGSGNRWGHLTAILIGMWFCWYRFRTIYLHDIDPQKA